MNTCRIASFLLPAALATSLAAQELSLMSSTSAAGLAFAVKGAAPGALVVLVLGNEPAAIRLPGDHVLGVQPDLWRLQVAEGGRPTLFADKLPIELVDHVVLVQAVAIDARIPIDQRGGLALSPVGRV